MLYLCFGVSIDIGCTKSWYKHFSTAPVRCWTEMGKYMLHIETTIHIMSGRLRNFLKEQVYIWKRKWHFIRLTTRATTIREVVTSSATKHSLSKAVSPSSSLSRKNTAQMPDNDNQTSAKWHSRCWLYDKCKLFRGNCPT